MQVGKLLWKVRFNGRTLLSLVGAASFAIVLLSSSGSTNLSDTNVKFDVSMYSGYYAWLDKNSGGDLKAKYHESRVWKMLDEYVAALQTGKLYSKKLTAMEKTSISAIMMYADEAVNEWLRDSILPSVTLAQMLIESASGTSYLAKNANNFFGIKCFNKDCKKGKNPGHCLQRHDDRPDDRFLVFDNPQEGFVAHTIVLKKDRYKRIFRYSSYKDWAWILQKKGYATSNTYCNDLKGKIEFYDLARFDNLTEDEYYLIIYLCHEHEDEIKFSFKYEQVDS